MVMGEHAHNKRLVADFLGAMAAADETAIPSVLDAYCRPDAVWQGFHPFNLMADRAAVEGFWLQLRQAFPDHEHRIMLILGGAYEGREWVSTLGLIAGTFVAPWIGIPPTQGLCFLRLGFNALVEDGKIARAYLLFDVVDVMRQAGHYPFRPMPGSAEQWPSPPIDTGVTANGHDAARGETALRLVREMQQGLGEMNLKDLSKAGYSSHWHHDKNWYGPAGIGSSRGKRGFREYHGKLFLQGFPDRHFPPRDPTGPIDGPGDYVQLGDGAFAMVSALECIHATHGGGGWLGLAPSGRQVKMRVADWYRIDDADKIIENWVLIDIPDILLQTGLDILDEMKYFADRTLRRWPD
jgi:predicted ester cyclase